MVTKRPTTKLLNTFSQLFNKSGNKGGDSSLAPASASAPLDQAAVERLHKQKQRNDTVCATELNHLRTLIREGRALESRTVSDTSQPPPALRTSGAGTLERSSILNKIDGAEAHLNQWWGTGSAALKPQQSPARAVTQDDDDLELDFTGLLALPETASSFDVTDSATVPLQESTPAETALALCLRDAALNYAEGDFDTAQSLLANMLATHATDDETAEALIFALFDVYRCSGQQDRFDALALDYAQRFGRSPGEWIAIVDPVATGDAPGLAGKGLDAQRATQTFWPCPAVLDAAAWADCLAHHPADSQVFSINWLALQHIDAAFAPVLSRQLQRWSASPVELQWVGLNTLMDALQMCRLGGPVSDSAPWWLMQLDLHCMAQQPEAFEELAMQYCVALELSPPSWKPVACKLVQADEVPLATDFVTTVPSHPAEAPTQTPLLHITFELQGNLTGNNSQALSALALASRQANQVDVSCTRLGRIDFEAANTLRDWLKECTARDCGVLFTQLPYLVLVYFQTIGIQELARLATGSR